MRKMRLILLITVVLLSLVLVGAVLADSRSGDVSSSEVSMGPETPKINTQPIPQSGQGIESISGSVVTFDPSAGGDDYYHPGLNQTFCFNAESDTVDNESVETLWKRFPDDWSISNVYVDGTPTCDKGGAFDSFGWSYVDSSLNEIRIEQSRKHANPEDRCVA